MIHQVISPEVGVIGVVLRMFIVAAALSSVVMVVAINHRNHRNLTFDYVISRAGISLVLLAVAYSTLESQWRNVPAAPRLWVMAVGLVWLNVGCAATLIEQRRKRKR